jgi:hypothetical protein
MPSKNVVAKTWYNSLNFDDLRWSTYALGNRPSGYVSTPTLIDTDINSGSLTNGENNKGAYLTLYGYSFGTKSNLGTSLGARVYMRDPLGDNTWHEVDNYRFLDQSPTYEINQSLMIRCQIGALGGSQTAGRLLDIKVNVAGTDTNVLIGQFMIQTGHFWFVSLNGNDSTGVRDDINHPYRYVQNWVNGSVAMASPSIFQAIGGIQPGDTIVIRGDEGTWSDTKGFNDTGFYPWLRFARGDAGFTPGFGGGTAPTGAAGHGYIHITAYPAVGANEDVHYAGPNGAIMGTLGSFANAGWGKYVSVSNLRMETTSGSTRDAGMVNFQNGADYWRVYGNYAGPWAVQSTVTNSSAIGGQGNYMKVFFNKVSSISGYLADQQNHGMYFGGQNSGSANNACQNCEVAYNWIVDSVCGSGIQFFWQNGVSGTPSSVFVGNRVHHNFVDTTLKYGINMADGNVSADIYDNIVINTGLVALRFVGPTGATFAMNWAYNTIWNWNTVNGAQTAAFLNDGFADAGSCKINHNIFAMPAGHTQTVSWYGNNGAGDGNQTMDENLYYDYAGTLTGSAAKDAHPITTSPLFTNPALNNFTCQTGGAGINAVTRTEAIAVLTDFYGIAKPISSAKDIGACEGIGT